jgi:hypothetical protein
MHNPYVRYARDAFAPFVAVNQSVEVGEVVMHSFGVKHKDQKVVIIRLCATPKLNARFLTDEGMQCIAKVEVDLSEQVARGVDLTTIGINVLLQFGRTELTCTAVDTATGKAVKAQVKFE